MEMRKGGITVYIFIDRYLTQYIHTLVAGVYSQVIMNKTYKFVFIHRG